MTGVRRLRVCCERLNPLIVFLHVLIAAGPAPLPAASSRDMDSSDESAANPPDESDAESDE